MFTATPLRGNIIHQKSSIKPVKGVVANNGDEDDSDSDIANPLTNEDPPQDETADVQAKTEYLELEINDIAIGIFLLVVYGGLRK